MGAIADAFATAWRDFNTVGVPSSGPFKPIKSVIRALGALVESAKNHIFALDDAHALPIKTWHVMNQVPSLLSWTGATISADPAVNTAAFNAMIGDINARGRAEFKVPSGEIPVYGALNMTGDNLRMCASGSASTIFNQGNPASDLLVVNGGSVSIENLCLYVPGATAGTALKWQGDKGKTHGLQILEAWVGFGQSHSGVFNATGWELFNTKYSALFLHDDVQGFTLSGATIASGDPTHGSAGLIRMEGFVSAPRLTNVEVLGGYRSLVLSGPSLVNELTNPLYGVLTSCFFDGAARESIVENTLQFEFVGVEFSGGRTGPGYDALSLLGNRGARFIGGKAAQAGRHGVAYGDNNHSATFLGFDTVNNGYTDANGRGFSFADNAKGYQVIGGQSGNGYYSTGLGQKYGVVIGAGCEGLIMGLDVRNNDTAPILNNSTSPKMQIIGCLGGESYERHSIGGGTPLTGILSGSTIWNPASLADGASATTTVTVTGAAPGDTAVASMTTILAAGWAISATVTAADTVSVVIQNRTGGTVDLASGTLKALVTKTA